MEVSPSPSPSTLTLTKAGVEVTSHPTENWWLFEPRAVSGAAVGHPHPGDDMHGEPKRARVVEFTRGGRP